MVLITLSGHLLILALEVIQGKRIRTRNIVYVSSNDILLFTFCYLISITACSCVLECTLASIITLLLFEPYGMILPSVAKSAIINACNTLAVLTKQKLFHACKNSLGIKNISEGIYELTN